MNADESHPFTVASTSVNGSVGFGWFFRMKSALAWLPARTAFAYVPQLSADFHPSAAGKVSTARSW